MKKFNCILLIDDDKATNEFHQLVIAEADVAKKVHVVTGGGEALDYLTNKGKYGGKESLYPQPDLIFLDINMPAMNGFEFIEEYEKLNENQKGGIVIIMLTASLNPDDEKMSQTIKSINGFRNKPLTVQMLHDLAKEYLHEKKLPDNAHTSLDKN